MCTSHFLVVLLLHVSVFLPILCNVNNSTFVATNEWQTVKEGQSIPAGLHVRLNLQTGKKEAKLMDDDSSTNDLAKLPPEDLPTTAENTPTSNYLSDLQKRLEEALKNIPGESYDQSNEHLEEIREKYRSYKDLKKEFESVDMDIKTDSEIINSLLDEYANSTRDTTRFLAILEDLDYLVHQIDNALWFIDRGGLETIIVPAIVNSTDTNIKVKSLQLLGALMQNNPKAQIKALEKNCGNYLNQILLTSTNNEEVSASIYAYGSLLRKFPFAQKENLPKTGTKALVSVLGREKIEIRTKVKVLTLISDLIMEQQETLNSVNAAQDDEGSREKLEQYRHVLLDFWLHDERFCDAVKDFVVDNYEHFGKDTDALERLLEKLNSTLNLCLDVWSQNEELRQAVIFLRDLFPNVRDDEFLMEISRQAKLVYERLFGRLKFNDEL